MCTYSLLSSFPNPEARMALAARGQALKENLCAAGQALCAFGAVLQPQAALLVCSSLGTDSSSSEEGGSEGLSCSTGCSRAVGGSSGVLYCCGKPQCTIPNLSRHWLWLFLSNNGAFALGKENPILTHHFPWIFWSLFSIFSCSVNKLPCPGLLPQGSGSSPLSCF